MKPITLTPCSSSRIHAHGHCPETNRLALQFKKKNPDGGDPIGGAVYHYTGFPADKYAELQAAESIGKFFGQVVNAKDDEGKLIYPFTKFEQEQEPA